MRHGPAGTSLIAALLLLLAAAACRDGEPGIAIEPPLYPRSSPITAGDYQPIRSGKSAREILEPLGFEPATGDEINGIRLFDTWTDYSHYRDLCGSSDFKEFREYDAVDFDWLPPGTFAVGPEAAAICPDDTVAGIGQELTTRYSTFQVWYSVGKRGLLHQGTAGGRFAGEVNGRPAVVVAETNEGWAHSQVGISTAKGIMMLEARDMPLEDVMKIAAGIRCEEC